MNIAIIPARGGSKRIPKKNIKMDMFRRINTHCGSTKFISGRVIKTQRSFWFYITTGKKNTIGCLNILFNYIQFLIIYLMYSKPYQ